MTLYIFGAGGGACELLESAAYLDCDKTIFDEVILIEDKPSKDFLIVPYLNKGNLITKKFKIISTDEFDGKADKRLHNYFISACDINFKTKIDKKYADFNWANFIHKSSDCLAINIGCGNWIGYGVHVGSDCVLGNHTRLNYGCKVVHGCQIGDYSFIGINAVVCAGTKIGKGVSVNSGAVIINKKITVGDNAVIGAGAVVTGNVAAGATVVGVPAREIKINNLSAPKTNVVKKAKAGALK